MNEVTFIVGPDGLYTGFQSIGHTGYAEVGKDIACASVSVLLQAVAIGAEDVVGANVHTVIAPAVPFITMESNEIAIVKRCMISNMIKTAKIVLKDLEKQFTGYIMVKEDEQRVYYGEYEMATKRTT